MQGGGTSAFIPILAGLAVGAATYGAGGAATTALLAGSAASTATSAGVSAYQQNQAAAAGSEQAKTQADVQKAAAAQRAAEVRRQLMGTLGAQQAILASRGIDPGDTGTPYALGADSINAAKRDLTTNRLNSLQQIGQSQFTRDQYGLQGSAAWVSGLGGIASAGTNYLDQRMRIGGWGSAPTTGSGQLLTYTGPQY